MKYLVALVVLVVSAVAASGHGSGNVESVVPGGAAAAAGVEAGDRIVSIDGRKLETRDDLNAILSAHEPGQTVPLVVERNGETSTLKLTFGAREDGGPSIGVRLRLADGAPGSGKPKAAAECLASIESRYRVDFALRELALDRGEDRATILACVERDMRRLTLPDPARFCNQVFMVHCSAGDLLAEIGETWIGRCGRSLGERLGRDVRQEPAWRTCAKSRLYERYVGGEGLPDVDACGAALDECAGKKDAATGTAR